MSTSMHHQLKRTWLLAILMVPIILLSFAIEAGASHFRYGTLSWSKTSTNGTVMFSFKAAFRRTSYTGTGVDGRPVTGNIITETVGLTGLNFGDGTPATGTLRFVVTSYSTTEDWILGEALAPNTTNVGVPHAYAGNGPYIAAVAGSARVGNLNNGANGSYRMETRVTPFDGNSSASATQPPIVTLPASTTAGFTVVGSDPNGDNVRYRLATSTESGVTTPTGLAIHPTTGVVTWNTLSLNQTNFWTVQIMIEDVDANNVVKSKTPIDFLLKIVPVVGVAPTVAINQTSPINVCNSTVNFTVTATDPDAGATVTLSAAGMPSGAVMSPSLPASGSSGLFSNFSWTPTAGQTGSFVVAFTVTDNTGQQTQRSMVINVSSPTATVANKVTCAGQPTTLTVATNANNASYLWNPGGATTQSINVSPSSTTNYTVTVSDGALACSTSATGTVTVNQLPNVVAASNSPVNQGGTITASATGANTYAWSGPNNYIAAGLGFSISNAQAIHAGTYTVEGTDANGCKNTGSTSVVIAPPAGALNFDGTNDYVRIANPYNSFTNELTVEWTAIIDPSSAMGSGISQSTENIDGANSMQWMMHYLPGANPVIQFYVSDNGVWKHADATVTAGWHKYTGVAGPTGIKIYKDGVLAATSPDVVTANILNAPNSIIALGKDSRWLNQRYMKGQIDEVRIWNRALCEGELINNTGCELNLPQNGLVEYYRFNHGFIGGNNTGVNTLADLSGNGKDGNLLNFTLDNTVANWVAGNVSGACASFVVPVAAITPDGPTTSCNPVVLNASTGTGYSYQWKLNGNNIANATNATYAATASGNYTVVVTANSCPVISAPVAVTILPAPSINAVNNGPVGLGSVLTLTASGNASSYAWSGPNNYLASGTSANINNAQAINDGVYTVVGTNAQGCKDTATTTTVVVTTPAGALNFDGVNDRVQMQPKVANLQNFTVEAWVKWNAFGYQTIYAEGLTSSLNPMFSMTMRSNGYELVLRNGSAVGLVANPTNSPVAPNTWTHVAFVRTSATTGQLFVNGVKTDDFTFDDPGNIPVNVATLGVRQRSQFDGFLNGSLDEVRVWDRALCQGEIQNNMNCELGGGQSGLISYYKFNQGAIAANNNAVTTLQDASGNNNTGILTSMALNGATSNWVAGNITGSCAGFVAPVATLAPDGATTSCNPVVLNANTGSGYTYQWKLNGNNIPSATAASYTATTTGSYSVVVTVNGCSATSSVANVTINAQPVFNTCPSNITVNTTASGCNAVVNYVTNVTAIPSASINYTLTGATTGSGSGAGSGLTFNKGVTNVTITAANQCGDNTCSFTVTVKDITAPNALAKNHTVYLDANGDASITAADINNGSTDNCGIANLSLSTTSFDCSNIGTGGVAVTPDHVGTVAQNTHSHGGGFNPHTNEFWYPQWAGPTVYKYNASHVSTGNFNAPVSEIMQLWMDKSSTDYYTANWGYQTVKRISQNGSTVWSYNTPSLGAAVTTDDQYAYVSSWGANSIIKLNKTTGVPAGSISLPGAIHTYGVMAYANGYLYIGGYASGWTSMPHNFNTIHTINAATGAYVGSVATATSAYNMAFDGQTMWINNFSSNIYGYKVSDGNAYGGAGGTNGVVLTVTDQSGNTDTASAYVTVRDTIKPLLTIPANATVNCNGSTATAMTGVATATDNCSATVSSADVSTQNANTNSAAHYNYTITRTWTAKDASNNTVSAAQIIAVQDITKPTINCPANVTVSCNASTLPAATGSANGSDNCSPVTISFTDVSTKGTSQLDPSYYNYTITRTWKATDVSGNSATCAQVITVQDVTPPVITLPANITINCQDNQDAINTGMASGADCSSVANWYTNVSTKDPNPANAGHYNYVITRTWFSRDVSNNISQANQIITVQDITKPTISVPANVTFNCHESTAPSATGSATGSDICSPLTITHTDASTQDASVTSAGHYNYVITRTWKVADASGNFVTGVQTINVQDVTKPTIACPADINVNATNGLCGAAVTFAPTITDNCGNPVVTYSHASGSVFPIGTTAVTITATDASNNSNNCSFNVTVVDNQAPVFSTVQYPAPALALSNVPEAADYNMVYQLNIPNGDVNWDFQNQIPYSVNNVAALSSVPYDRIAYMMELNNKWVWVSMNAFTSDLSRVGLHPGITGFQQTVANMNVFASANAGVTTGTGITTGNIEMWSNCYAGGSGLPVIGGNNSRYDHNDVMAGANCYGSFQVHNWGAQQTLLAYNSWSVNEGGGDDVGIGNNPGTHSDWTFTYNNNTYTTKRLYVFVKPAPACPKDIVVNNTPGQCGAIVNYTTPTANDNCAGTAITRTAGPASGSLFPLGVTTVTHKATDASGNTTLCTFTVTVSDKEAPEVTCPASTTINCHASSAPDATGSATATDNCDVLGITHSDVSTQHADVNNPAHYNYTITRTWTATDIHDNNKNCVQTITVQDVTDPSISIPQNATVNCQDATTTEALGTATGNDNCSPVSVSHSDVSTQSANVLSSAHYNYTITRTWTVKDVTGNDVSANQVITVQDITKPVINCAADMTIACDGDSSISTTGMTTATDNCGPVMITRSDVSTQSANVNASAHYNYTITRTWVAKDVTGNSSSCTQLITVEDASAPTITNCPSSVTVNCQDNNTPAALGSMTADDNCSPVAITHSDVSTQDADANAAGHYNYAITRTWTATDVTGNSNSCTQVITVQDVTKPSISVPQNATVNCQGDKSTGANGTATGTDNCSPVAITYSDASTQNANPNNAGHYNYVITRTWTATDVTGNHTSADQTITVQDITNPGITVPANVTLNCQDDKSTTANGNATGTDNCSPVAITHVDASTQDADPNNAGHYNYVITRTWTATDVTGNNVSADQTITVQDVTNPGITVPANVTLNCQDDKSTTTNGTATGTDNCSPVAITYSDASTQNANPNNAGHYNYVITRTWTATDVTGNNVSADQTITVQDVTNPGITVPANVTLNCQDDKSTTTNGTATGTDNCSPVAITYSDASTQNANPNNAGHYNYVITRTWTATDVTGNNTSADQTITVQDITAPSISCPANATVSCKTSVADNGTAIGSDNCSPVAITSTDASTQNSNPANSGHYNYTITRTWKATDVSGNFTTCDQVITVKALNNPAIAITPVNTINANHQNHTIYLGYGPQSVTLASTVQDGVGNRTYSWSPVTGVANPNSATTSVSPQATTTYTVTITDATGCSITKSFTVNVIDVRCSNGKVKICHYPPGNVGNPQQQCLPTSAIAAHLAHGCVLGDCPQNKNGEIGEGEGDNHGVEAMVATEVKVYPNPNTGVFTVELPSGLEKSEVVITDMAGKVIQRQTGVEGNKLQFDLGPVARGMYMLHLTNGSQNVRTRISVQ